MSDVPAEENFNEEDQQSSAVHLVETEDGLIALGGNRGAVEKELNAHGLLRYAREVGVEKLAPLAQTAGVVVQEGVKVAGDFGMWLKLTPESADAVRKAGLMDSGVKGVKYAMLGEPGKVAGWISVEQGKALLTNPALIGGAAGILAQAAKQSEAVQLKELLVSIDSKLDMMLRNERNDLLAEMAGLEDLVRRAYVVREQKGVINATTWSQVDGATLAISTTLRKALGRIEAMATGLEKNSLLGEIAKSVEEARSEAEVWLSVVARCFKLMDETAVLELDRVFVDDPDSVNEHRLALGAFRDQYREEVLGRALELIRQMDGAAGRADVHQIIHRPKAKGIVESVEAAKQILREVLQSIGVDIATEAFELIDWREAIKSPAHIGSALKEAGLYALGAGSLMVIGVVAKGKFNPDGKA